MGDYPGSGYKMSSYGLKLYNPQETVGQWTQCCKVQHTCVRKQTAICYFVVGCGLGEEAKLFHFLLILARRCDQEEPCCHYRRRRCYRLVESRETKIFRSCTRYQLFPCQDSASKTFYIRSNKSCCWGIRSKTPPWRQRTRKVTRTYCQ